MQQINISGNKDLRNDLMQVKSRISLKRANHSLMLLMNSTN